MSSPGSRAIYDDESVTVRQAFLAMSELIWRFAESAGDDMGALLRYTALRADGPPVDPAAWADWLRCVSATKLGIPVRSDAVIISGPNHAPIPDRARMFDSGLLRAFETDALSVHDAFLVVSDYLWEYSRTAGDDVLTLIGDTDIETDGIPFDAAALSEWMQSVERIKGGVAPRSST